MKIPPLRGTFQLTLRFPCPTIPPASETSARPLGAVTLLAVLEIFDSEYLGGPGLPGTRSRFVAGSSTGGIVR